jgi:hypothetical protein
VVTDIALPDHRLGGDTVGKQIAGIARNRPHKV